MNTLKILLLFTFFLFPSFVFSNFSSTTQVTGPVSFEKEHWIRDLRVHEDYLLNPFTNSKIIENKVVCQGNNCSCGWNGCVLSTSYIVDGKTFGPGHPLYKNTFDIRQNWTTQSPGIKTRIEYRQNTYTKSGDTYIPNQSVLVRRYYEATYLYDETNPTCGEVNYYNDIEMTQPFTYEGWWLNKPKYYTMVCADGETWCKCEWADKWKVCDVKDGKIFSMPQLLGHNIKPTVSFYNTVLLNEPACTPGWSFKMVLFDMKTPRVDLVLDTRGFWLNLETNQKYDTLNGKKYDGIEIPWELYYTLANDINLFASGTTLKIALEDSYLSGSVHGVSWIKTYALDVYRISSSNFSPTTEIKLSSCSRTQTFPPYNVKGSITASDVKSWLKVTCSEFQTSGRYKIVMYADDWAWNKTRATSYVNIYPNTLSVGKSILSVIDKPASGNTTWKIFGNNADSFLYTFQLRDKYGNPLYDRNINSIQQNISWYSSGKTIYLDQVSQKGPSALRIIPAGSLKTDQNGDLKFNLYSYTPGTYTQRFQLQYYPWNASYVQATSGVINTSTFLVWSDETFDKPITASLDISLGGQPLVWVDQTYSVSLSNSWNVAFSNGKLDFTKNGTVKFTTNHKFEEFTVIDNDFIPWDLSTSFSWSVQPTTTAAALDEPIFFSNIPISYNYSSQSVKYYLDNFTVNGCDVNTLWVNIVGNIQWDGKWSITGQDSNFSDVSVVEARKQIQSQAYEMVRWMKSGDMVNGVKYVEWDFSLSGNPNYETLVVRNGNLSISGNVNSTWKTFGIIVLSDNSYKVETDYAKANGGNIYIQNTVTKIHAFIYADGVIRSANASWNSYADSQITTPLDMKGALFTRNTVWWAVLAGSSYILPGGTTTTNLSLAEKYDLNFLRKANLCINPYSLKLEYDASIQQSPPKWFAQ